MQFFKHLAIKSKANRRSTKKPLIFRINKDHRQADSPFVRKKQLYLFLDLLESAPKKESKQSVMLLYLELAISREAQVGNEEN